MKYVDIRDLPPCSYSPDCLRLIDDLDVPMTTRAPARLSYIDDLKDQRRLRQLRSHVPGCPTCSALLAEARRTRSQQRLMLHHFLIANEKDVPSTTGAIFAAIQREQALSEAIPAEEIYAPFADPLFSSPFAEPEETLIPEPIPLPARAGQHRHLFQHMLTLATLAAVILAAVGLFNRFANQPSTTKAPDSLPNRPAQPDPTANNAGWDSVVMGLTLLSATGFTVYSFNAANGQMTMLFASTQNTSEMNLEAVSGDGRTLLYDVVSPDQQKTYATFSTAAPIHQFYRLAARQGGNAIWMDAAHVLLQTNQGTVLELDTRSGVVLQQWPIAASKLTFYHQPFLYFTGAEQFDPGTLYRVNLTQASPLPQKVATSAPDTRFWLSPDGTTVFYANTGSYGVEGIYAVNSDGSNVHILRAGPGTPIGYAADNTLMLMQQVGSQVEVIKLGATPEEKEQIVLANAAPNATSLCEPAGTGLIIALCDQDIALEPYGRGLLLHTYYADGSQNLIYDNLATGTTQKILSLANDASVQLPGWSKISSTGSNPVSSVAPLAMCA